MIFTDASPLSGVRRTKDGYLSAEIRSARIGIQTYAGHEVGKPELATVNIYRAPEEVFSADAMASMAHRPVVIDHPDEEVTSANWRDLAVGMTGDVITKEGGFVRVPLALMDSAAIKAVEAGKREVSWGYRCELQWGDGETPEGEKYQARQVGIRANHLAVVTRGRAGGACRIGDRETWGDIAPSIKTVKGMKMADAILRTITHDGVPVEVTDQAAAVIAKLEKKLAASAAKFTDAETAHKAALDAKDTEIGTLKADKKKLEDAAIKPADLDKMVADRAALVATVKAIDAKAEVSGKTDAELRKAAVAAKLGDEMVKDASEAEIAGMFKAVAKDVKTADPYRDAVSGGLKTIDTNVNDNGQDAYEARLRDAWKGQKEA